MPLVHSMPTNYHNYSRKFRQEKFFTNFCQLLSLAKFISVNLLSRVNDYIEDLVTFIALVKNYSAEYFYNIKGLGEILSSENFQLYDVLNNLEISAYYPLSRVHTHACIGACIELWHDF